MPSWIGPWEIAIVLVIALLIFGPKKLPDLGSSLGKSIRGFKSGLKDAQDEVKTALSDDGTAEAPASAEATMASTTAASTTASTAAPAAEATEATESAETAATTETTTEQS
jgi:sec-independent protein translocase protein TatA